jgi:hypothetical protein
MSDERLLAESQSNESVDRPSRKIDNFGPAFSMMFIIGVMIVVIIFVLTDRDPDTIVIDPNGNPTEAFSATAALDYADRISRIAEVTVGGVLTLTLALVGFSWLSTNARIERDRQELADHKDSLEKSLHQRLQAQESRLQGLSSQLDETKSDLRSYIDQQVSTLQGSEISREFGTRANYGGRRRRQTNPGVIHQSLDFQDFDEGFDGFVDLIRETRNRVVHAKRTSIGFEAAADGSLGEVTSIVAMVDYFLPFSVLSRITDAIPSVSDEVIKKNAEKLVQNIDTLIIFIRGDEDAAKSYEFYLDLMQRIKDQVVDRIEKPDDTR